MVKKIGEALKWFIHSRTDGAMMARTAVEAAASYVTANLGTILNLFHLEDEVKTVLMGLFMVIYTAILSSIRKAKNEDN